jgi:hypothetical protein
MDDIERLREEVAEAEKQVRLSKRWADMDRESFPDQTALHEKDAKRIQYTERLLEEARQKLDMATASR